MTGVCAREQRGRLGYKDTYSRTGHVMMEVEPGAKLPQAKAGQRLLKTHWKQGERLGADSSTQLSEGNNPTNTQILDF